jgi:hypothetical protein
VEAAAGKDENQPEIIEGSNPSLGSSRRVTSDGPTDDSLPGTFRGTPRHKPERLGAEARLDTGPKKQAKTRSRIKKAVFLNMSPSLIYFHSSKITARDLS